MLSLIRKCKCNIDNTKKKKTDASVDAEQVVCTNELFLMQQNLACGGTIGNYIVI